MIQSPAKDGPEPRAAAARSAALRPNGATGQVGSPVHFAQDPHNLDNATAEADAAAIAAENIDSSGARDREGPDADPGESGVLAEADVVSVPADRRARRQYIRALAEQETRDRELKKRAEKKRLADEAAAPKAARPGQGGWTIPFVCAGLALIAACILIPQADENRRLFYECEHLKVDLDQIQRQISNNDEFLKRVADDPGLAERLAQRQLRFVREGADVLELKGQPRAREMSPFTLVAVPPPPPLPEYSPIGGQLASLIRDPRHQLYLMGAGLMLMAFGLVMGHARPR